MRAVLQRVKQARVEVDGTIVGAIAQGWLILLGISRHDTPTDLSYLIDKTLGLRAFADAEQRMNLSIVDIAGQILVVSQFTLFGDCRKGRRPSYTEAAPPELAEPLYKAFAEGLRAASLHVATGEFGADMRVHMEGDGPVTLLLDSRKP